MVLTIARAIRRTAGRAAPLVAILATGCAAIDTSSPLRPALVRAASGDDSLGSKRAELKPAAADSEVFQEMPPLSPRPAQTPAPDEAKGAKSVPVQEQTDKPEEKKSVEPPKEEKEATKSKEPWYSVHEQGTVITQKLNNFRSPYVGPLSLIPGQASATTETATIYSDVRLWRGADLVFNPEISGGAGFSGTSGLAGFSNGEATRVGALEPTPYIARLFLRQAWGFGGEQEKVEDAPNQIAGVRDMDRFTIIIGKLAATDVVDNNIYSHDPRTQFLDWALMYDAAWDYPANVRGYTYGIALDFSTVFYAVRYGIFAEPAIANGAEIDPHFLKANGQILEVEERYHLGDSPGRVREWVYLNHAHMGDYRESLNEMPVDPKITETRSYRFKYGYGLNIEQELTKELGAFVKAGWSDGHTESWAFTEVDRTVAFGLLLKGKWWERPNDQIGLAGVINGLSLDHRDYLRAGGIGFIIGDGRLNYAPEQILETYYNWEVVKGINVTIDFEGVNHPAYNADRGPVAIGSIRVHLEH